MYKIKWTENKSYRYVIHKHYAKRAGLHYDIRILTDEDNLESFATRKDPLKLVKGGKQLLIRQPLHEKYWLNFRGEISDGYGAGRLIIHDAGKVIVKEIKSKSYSLEFKGKFLKGRYALVYLDDQNYLLVRSKGQK